MIWPVIARSDVFIQLDYPIQILEVSTGHQNHPGAPMATGRTGEPDAPLDRNGRIIVQDVHTLSFTSFARLAFWIWRIPEIAKFSWCMANGSPGGVPFGGPCLPISWPSKTGSVKGLSSATSTTAFFLKYCAAS